MSVSVMPAQPAPVIPICKLRGVPTMAQRKLKLRKIVNAHQLLALARSEQHLADFASATDIEPDVLLDLAQQADLLRVNGIGIMFMLMVKEVGITSAATLARQDPVALHGELCAYNRVERLTRRSPTLEEVTRWIEQAGALADG